MKKRLLGILIGSLVIISACAKAEPVSVEPVTSSESIEEYKEEASVEVSTESSESVSVEESSDAEEKLLGPFEKTIDECLGSFDDEISAYKAMLNFMVDNSVTIDLCDNTFFESDASELAGNRFTITDIDNDGKTELIIDWSNPNVMAGYTSYILKYETESGKWIDEEKCGGALTFYDNGIVYVDASHNQGYGMTIWPHTVLKYDPLNDCYNELGNVDSMDKEMVENTGVEYPEEKDPDGVGTVYILKFDELGYPYENYSQAEYYELLEKIIGNAKIIEVDYRYITKENVKALNEE